MKLVRYTDKEDSFLQTLSEVYPYPFLKEYHAFEKIRGNDPVLVYSSDGSCIPLVLQKRQIFTVGRCLYPPLKNSSRLSEAEERLFLEALLVFLKEINACIALEAPTPLDVYFAKPKAGLACKFGSYTIDLQQSEEVIFSKFSSNYRNEIRKAEQLENVRIASDDRAFNDFYRIYSSVLEKQGLASEARVSLESLRRCMGGKVKCATIYVDDIPQAGAMIPVSMYAGYYLYGATDANALLPGLAKLLHWHLIKEMKAEGVKRYIIGGARLSDVRGTKYDGIQQFKARFGADLVDGLLWKADISPWRAGVYRFLLTLKNLINAKKYFKDLIDQEIANGSET